MEFTYQAYREMVEELAAYGYELTGYEPARKRGSDEKWAILRHDVDFDLKKAAEFALWESRELNVRATYFILLSSDFYNPFSRRGREELRGIQASGHWIGLHYDERAYGGPQAPEQMKVCVEEEKRRLEELLGQKVTAVSMHRPSAQALGRNDVFDGLVNCYGEEYFRHWKYLSDSRRSWKENPLKVIREGNAPQLQLLTHPFWYQEREEDARRTLSRFFRRAGVERYDEASDNLRSIEEFSTREEWL